MPLLRTMLGGEGAEFVVTTRVFGGGRVWLPLANDVVAVVGGGWRESRVEPGAVTAAPWPCAAFWPGPCPCVP